MSNKKSRLQLALYWVFIVTGSIAVLLGLLLIWGFMPGPGSSVFLARVLGTCSVLALASAFAMSATRLVSGRAPEDDG